MPLRKVVQKGSKIGGAKAILSKKSKERVRFKIFLVNLRGIV